jgi:predicted nucleic acid-binding protein
MPLNLPQATACFVDANIFVHHFVELGAPSTACHAFLDRVVRSELDAVSTPARLADVVHRVMGVEAQNRFNLGSCAVAWLQRHPQRIRELSAFFSMPPGSLKLFLSACSRPIAGPSARLQS